MSAPFGALARDATHPWARRRLKLHGSEVSAWFSARGWNTADQPRADRHAFVDELVTPSLTARRLWYTPMALTASADAVTERGLTVWLQADGDVTLTAAADTQLQLSPGAAYFHRRPPLAVTNSRPTARVEVSLDHHDIDLRSLPRHVDVVDSPSWVAVTSVVNAVLNASETPDTRTLSLLALSVESLVAAMWFESQPETVTAANDTFARALELIHDHAGDPTFTVADLADRLDVTRMHLTRVFRERGAMPSRALKRERLLRARRMLSLTPTADLATVAAACGFSSERMLREALRAKIPPEETLE